MGVDRWDFIHYQWHDIHDISPHVIAIDAPNYLIRRIQAFEYRSKGNMERIPTSHVYVTLSIIRSLIEAHYLPIFIFDGPPETLKRPVNPRLVSDATVAYTRFKEYQDVFDAKLAMQLWESRALRWYFAAANIKDLCRSIGIPAFTAPSEAEMMAAAVCMNGMCGTVLSNDVDTLLFGSPKVSRSIRMSKQEIESVDLNSVTHEVGVDLDVLRDLAIVSGCDFHHGIKGIGPRKGIVLLKRFGGLENLLKARGFGPHERESYLEARSVLDEADNLSVSRVSTKFNAPLKSRVVDILSPLMSNERAEKYARDFLTLWKGYGEVQASLEGWM